MKIGDKIKIKNYTDKTNDQPIARVIAIEKDRVKIRLDGIGGIFVFKVEDVEVIDG